MDKFLVGIKKFIEENHMLENVSGLVLGLSGGADSVCLLRVMCELAGCFDVDKKRICCVHVNHMIRGREADADEQFSRQLCESLGVPVYCFRKDIAAYAKELGCSVEEAGRKYRYETFHKVMSEHGLNKIAVAHNKNDVAETLIFNMLRGTGINGMSGIKAVREDIIRPLLNTDRAAIEKYLRDINQSYCTDSTNLSTAYDRNKIRHIILPELEGINPNAVEHLALLADQSARTYEYISKKTEDEMKKVVWDAETDFEAKPLQKTITIDINKFNCCDEIIKENIIHQVVARVCESKKDIGRKHILAVMELAAADTGKQVKLPYGVRARRSYERLIVEKDDNAAEEFHIDIDCDGKYDIRDLGTFFISRERWSGEKEVSKKIYTKMVDYGKIKGTVCIRTPKDGDYIIIDGKGNSKKMSRLFIDEKIDREKRLTWPVVACGDEIIWAVGLRYSEAYKIDKDTDDIMIIKFEGKGD